MQTKPRLTLFQIFMMSFGFFGIQHGFSIQFARMSSIYEKLGAKPDEIPFLWLAAPMTGLLIQPIIGYMSDKTWCWLGRRRPYFLSGAVLATIALIFMPYSNAVWMAAGLLWILDASINISMEPFRAFVADKLPGSQVSTGYAMQTLMIGIGGFLGYKISAYDWLSVFPGLSSFFPTSLHVQFSLCALIYFSSIMVTVISTPEYPPENLNEFRKEQSEKKGFKNLYNETISALKFMPKPMKRLAVVQFFTWMGLFCMWIYYALAVAHHVFGASDPHSDLYEKGISAASDSMGIYNWVSMMFAVLIPVLAKKISKSHIHFVGLLLAGFGLLSVWFVTDPKFLYLSMIGVGIGWATILSMPYALIVDYIPKEKYGIYMGIFNMFIVIPEILASLLLGKIMASVLHNNYALAISLGGAFMVIASILVLGLKKYELKE